MPASISLDDYPSCAPGPFAHGVASGDPLADRVIIWTRYTSADRAPNGPPGANALDSYPVDWEVATGSDFAEVVASGTQQAAAEHDWTVKVDVTGLRPATTYYYRFSCGGDVSMTGRTRTAGPVEHLRLAALSCSSYWSSYFSGLGHLARRDDIDLVVHLGDYVYDFIDSGEQVRSRVGFEDLSHPDNRNWLNLAEVRRRYALWRSDPNLVRAHQQHPFMIIWDDHDLSTDPENELPVPDVDVEETVTIDDTLRAFWEWTPSRPPKGDGAGDWLLIDDHSYPSPEEPRHLYRRTQYGDLAEIFALDSTTGLPSINAEQDPSPTDNDSLLGKRQYRFLTEGLERAEANGTTWKLLLNQAWFSVGIIPHVAKLWFPKNFGVSRWTGFPDEYRALRKHLATITNPVMITGDEHGNLVSDIIGVDAVDRGYDAGPLEYSRRDGAEPGNLNAGAVRRRSQASHRELSVGVEFAPSSMGRGGVDDKLAKILPKRLGPVARWVLRLIAARQIGEVPRRVRRARVSAARKAAVEGTHLIESLVAEANQGVQFLDWVEHGYGIIDLTRERAIFELWWQDKRVSDSPDLLGHQFLTRSDSESGHRVNPVDDPEPTAGTRVASAAPDVDLRPR